MHANENDYISIRIPVPLEYEEVFSHFYVARNQSPQSVTKTLLPSYQTILVFSLGVPVSFCSPAQTTVEIDKCLVIGPVKQAFGYTLPPGSEILVINFRDDAFYRFFGQILAGHVPMNPDDLLDENCFTQLWDEIRLMPTSERTDHLLAFCKPYLRTRIPTLESLVTLANQSSGINPIKAVAQQTSQTERNVQLTHKKHFGYSSKELSRYQRFFKAIQLIETRATSDAKVDWFDIIAQCGYYDQSQLTHDFKHFINLSPARFLKFQQDICQARIA